MRRARVLVNGRPAGMLEESEAQRGCRFTYDPEYRGEPISLAMPLRSEPYAFDRFPPFFDGLLPEGYQLESLLRARKIDRSDLFAQLLAVGQDLVGAVTVERIDE